MTAPTENKGRFASIQSAQNNFSTSLPSGDVLAELPSIEGLFTTAKITGERWNKLFPYQLIVVEKDKENGWKRALEWQFTLPFPPQSIEIDTPFAITTSATLGGVIEEHNGAPFRMISLAGTTGILPLKGAPDSVPEFNLAQGIFAGTISAVNTVTSDLQRLGILNQEKNVVPNEDFLATGAGGTDVNKTTGYSQAHFLKQFLESFAQYKKTQGGRNLRLALALWKDNSVYLVTPVLYKLSRTADSPFEYKYNLQFKAWARIELDGGPTDESEHSPMGRDPNAMALAVSKLQGARTALEDARKIIQGFRADINNALFTPLRELILISKSVGGIGLTLADLPANIVADCKESFLELFGNESQSNTSTTPSKQLELLSPEAAARFKKLSQLAGKNKTGAGRQQGASAALTGADPANKLFDNPDDHFDIFSKVTIASLKLSPAIQNKINQEKQRVALFTRKDFEIKRDLVASVMLDYAEAVGQGSDTYSRIYGLTPKTTASQREATEADFEVLFSLNKLLLEMNKFCVSNRMDPNKTDSIEYIAGLARQSNIAFTEPRSKILVPFPYDHTLEQVALRYLGAANRWHEIAALNGLREPWVDEVGFDIALTTNGSGNTVQVSDKTNLFNGQLVFISSSTVKREKRRITGITTIANGIYLVYLSGDSDLDKFTVVDQSTIHAYLPDTVNSQMSIYIPSQEDPRNEDFQVKSIQGVDYFDNLVRVGGISILLTSNNDIAISPDGRSRLAVGLTNIVQKARIALATSKGSLIQHPNYGLPIQPGDSTADSDPKDILKSIQEMFSNDRSFSSVNSVSVLKSGPTSRITINVGIAGTSQVIPISAEIR